LGDRRQSKGINILAEQHAGCSLQWDEFLLEFIFILADWLKLYNLISPNSLWGLGGRMNRACVAQGKILNREIKGNIFPCGI